MRVINMDALSRKHYLKHYQGSFGMSLQEGQAMTGQIESIDMEDGTVAFNNAGITHYVDGSHVTPSLKQFKDLTTEDINNIFQNLKWSAAISVANDFSEWQISHDIDKIILRRIGTAREIIITREWSIIYRWGYDIHYPKNIGSIIFLLCEMGFDVTGIFKTN